jgi:sulfur carrier protein
MLAVVGRSPFIRSPESRIRASLTHRCKRLPLGACLAATSREAEFDAKSASDTFGRSPGRLDPSATTARLLVSHAAQPVGLQIRVNGEPRTLGAGVCLADLIETLGLGGRKLAVAVNREVVPRGQYRTRRLDEGDRVEILEAVGGG